MGRPVTLTKPEHTKEPGQGQIADGEDGQQSAHAASIANVLVPHTLAAGRGERGWVSPSASERPLPGVLAEVVDRAGHGYDRWAELVAQAGYCHHPIRLAGRVEQADQATGEVRPVYDSEREPDGVLLKACGTRRESRCPSCAATYRADAYQLLAAGLKGGKGVSPRRSPRILACS